MRRHDELTAADRDLLDRIAQGRRDKQIACDLNASRPAITARVKKIAGILGAENRAHAVALYLAPERFKKRF